MKRSIKASNEPRVTCIGTRIEIIHYGARDYGLCFDGNFERCYTSLAEAEHAGAMMIEEEANALAAGAKRAA